ncbi:MAG: hypothetical protein Q7R88_01060 [bacterium]|nr:hypothetical protein [bacterium]
MSSENTSSPQEKPSSLEHLEDRLYSRTPPPLRHDEESGGSERHIRIAPSWTSETEEHQSGWFTVISRIMPHVKRFFVASIVFFLFAAGIAFYGFWRGGNTVSPQNISLAILGPVSAPAGEELSFEVTVGNLNEMALDSVDLLIEYPAGSRNPKDLSAELLRYRESLGTLSAGESVTRRLSIVPFGEAGEKKSVTVSIEYRQKDSNAIFSRDAGYEFLLSAAPVTAVVEAPKEVSPGQTFEVTFEITSNAHQTIEGLLLKATYPFGFTFAQSSPSPSSGKDTWQLGDLKPSERRVVRVKGKLEAAEEAERTFRFAIGTQSPKNERLLGTVYLTETVSVTLKEPFVGLELLLNGERGKTFVARGGENVRADLVWTNNLPTKITDLGFSVRLLGTIFDAASVEAGSGVYNATTNTIVFDSRSESLSVVEPGRSERLSFSFNLLSPGADPSRFKNPSMQIEVSAQGRRLDEVGAFQDVSSSVVREIKVASALSLISRLFYASGSFGNLGPIPPKAEQETTYTIRWSLSNSSSAVAHAKVSAVLPSYVRWQNRTSPATETVTYNPVGGEVVWEVGDIEAGVGVGTAAREVSFQIGLLPSAGQVGTSPVLIGEAKAVGDDRFTGGDVVSNVRPALTTGSLSDPSVAQGSGVVVK